MSDPLHATMPLRVEAAARLLADRWPVVGSTAAFEMLCADVTEAFALYSVPAASATPSDFKCVKCGEGYFTPATMADAVRAYREGAAPVQPTGEAVGRMEFTYEESEFAIRSAASAVRSGEDIGDLWLDTLECHAIAALQDAHYYAERAAPVALPRRADVEAAFAKFRALMIEGEADMARPQYEEWVARYKASELALLSLIPTADGGEDGK